MGSWTTPKNCRTDRLWNNGALWVATANLFTTAWGNALKEVNSWR